MRLNVVKFIYRISPLSWELLLRSLTICCALLLGAIFLLIDAGEATAATRDTYRLAREMCVCAQGGFFVAVVCAAVIDEHTPR